MIVLSSVVWVYQRVLLPRNQAMAIVEVLVGRLRAPSLLVGRARSAAAVVSGESRSSRSIVAADLAGQQAAVGCVGGAAFAVSSGCVGCVGRLLDAANRL